MNYILKLLIDKVKFAKLVASSILFADIYFEFFLRLVLF